MRIYFFLPVAAVTLSCTVGKPAGSDFTHQSAGPSALQSPKFSPTDLARISDDKVVDQLNETASSVLDSADDRRGACAALPKGLQTRYATAELDAEVNNGGFNQYFWNSSGELCGVALNGFKMLGDADRAKLLRQAVEIHLEEAANTAGLDRGDMKAFKESYRRTKLNRLDDAYYALKSDLGAEQLKLVRSHPDFFNRAFLASGRHPIPILARVVRIKLKAPAFDSGPSYSARRKSMDPRLSHLFSLANKANAEGRLDDCEMLCRGLLAQLPNNVATLVLSGVVAAKKENGRDAAGFFERAILADPRCTPAYQWLSMVHRQLGEIDAAEERARQAVELNPQDALTLHNHGLCLLDLGRAEEAEEVLIHSANLAPTVAQPFQTLGLALRVQGKNKEAIRAYRRSLELEPASSPALIALRDLLMAENDFQAACDCGRRILAISPGSAEANLWLAKTLTDAGHPDKAQPYLQKGMELPPDSAFAHSLLGSVLQVRGRIHEAETQFRKSLELEPVQGSAWLAFVSNRRLVDSDRRLVQQMEDVLANPVLSSTHRSQLHYALGKALEDFGDHEEAMHHFDEANRLVCQLRRQGRPFDPRNLALYEQAAKRLNPPGARISDSARPLFVIGMIRSGTTLVEQILSSHSRIGAAGEQSFWLGKGMPFIATGKLDEHRLRQLAREYDQLLISLGSGEAHIVDKMPMNYLIVGLLHAVFPNAKFVHTVRNPVDTCISIYTTPISTPLEWANDKESIVYAYRHYLRIMEFWHSTLPPGSILDVSYEALVSDPEPVTRALIDFLGLEWEDACLHPERNRRTVVTPSVWQVRQPIYKTSMNRWKRFEPWLGAFSELV